jgi:hypothetical protein
VYMSVWNGKGRGWGVGLLCVCCQWQVGLGQVWSGKHNRLHVTGVGTDLSDIPTWRSDHPIIPNYQDFPKSVRHLWRMIRQWCWKICQNWLCSVFGAGLGSS